MVSEKHRELLNQHHNLLKKYMKEDGKHYSEENGKRYNNSSRVKTQLNLIQAYFGNSLPHLKPIIQQEFSEVMSSGFYPPYETAINNYLQHLIDLVKIESIGEEDIDEGKIFLGIKEKLKQAGQSFRNKDYPGLFSSLHTIVELMLKDKLSIPLSIGEIKTGRIIGVCIKRKVFPEKETMLKDIDSKVCQIDNKIKHNGYHPSPEEASNALLISEQSIRLLEKISPKLGKEIKEEISKLMI
jgi:hypothetical protein